MNNGRRHAHSQAETPAFYFIFSAVFEICRNQQELTPQKTPCLYAHQQFNPPKCSNQGDPNKADHTTCPHFPWSGLLHPWANKVSKDRKHERTIAGGKCKPQKGFKISTHTTKTTVLKIRYFTCKMNHGRTHALSQAETPAFFSHFWRFLKHVETSKN